MPSLSPAMMPASSGDSAAIKSLVQDLEGAGLQV
jgi:hypothetical protein